MLGVVLAVVLGVVFAFVLGVIAVSAVLLMLLLLQLPPMVFMFVVDEEVSFKSFKMISPFSSIKLPFKPV